MFSKDQRVLKKDFEILKKDLEVFRKDQVFRDENGNNILLRQKS